MPIFIVISKLTGNIMAVYKYYDNAKKHWPGDNYNIISMGTMD